MPVQTRNVLLLTDASIFTAAYGNCVYANFKGPDHML